MDNKEFKTVFNEIARKNNFSKAFGGWFRESAECIVVLDLQKSNFSNLYYLNIKIYVQGMFGNTYVQSKDLVKKDVGDIFKRQPPNYNNLFDFNTQVDDLRRQEWLERLFNEFIDPFANKALSKTGIRELSEKGEVYLLPAVRKELNS